MKCKFKYLLATSVLICVGAAVLLNSLSLSIQKFVTSHKYLAIVIMVSLIINAALLTVIQYPLNRKGKTLLFVFSIFYLLSFMLIVKKASHFLTDSELSNENLPLSVLIGCAAIASSFEIVSEFLYCKLLRRFYLK